MSMTTEQPLMTGIEFIARYGDESGVELLNGRVVKLPPTGGRHGEVCCSAAYIIGDFVKRANLGRMMLGGTFTQTTSNPDSYRGADVCFLSYTRLQKDQKTPKGPIPAPDLVFEVKSPTDRVNQLAAKATEYLEVGVAVVVLLIPETRIAAVFRSDDAPLRLTGDDRLELPDVLPGFSVPVSEFFA